MIHRTIVATSALLALMAGSSHAQTDKALSAQDRMKSCDPKVAVAAAHETLRDPSSVDEPISMFIPAHVLFDGGEKDEALFYLYAAQLRARYQLIFKKGDRGQLLSVMMMTVAPPINNYGFSDTAKMQRVLGEVLQWDAATRNPLRDQAHSPEQEAEIEKVYAGYRSLQKKLVDERVTLEQQAKSASAAMDGLASRRHRCQPGQIDPSLVDREIARETKQAEQIVRTSREVLAASGGVERMYKMSHIEGRDSNMPTRYTFSVSGEHATFVEVDVKRTSGASPEFVIACVSYVSPSHRDVRDKSCPTAKPGATPVK